jgi:uncharacterized protein YbaP (TraB family)
LLIPEEQYDWPEEWPEASPALWEVTAANGNKAWLFGTVHALPDGVNWQSEAVYNALSQADLLVVEIDNLEDQNAAQAAFRHRAFTDDLPPILQRVDHDDRAKLIALLEQADMGTHRFVGMENWAAALTLASAVNPSNSENGVDRALMSRGWPTYALESFHIQFDVFDQLSDQDQIDLLMMIAHDAQSTDPATGIIAWLTGDMDALEAQAMQEFLGDPGLKEAVLDQRNLRWMEQLVPMVENGREPFIAVGIAHMLGDAALPVLFTEAGFEVERLQ